LVSRGIDSYMAVPFVDGDGKILGHLAVFDERPMPAEPRRAFIFRIFAARASAELERLRAEQRLQHSEARYRDLYENAPSAYLIVGTDARILGANRRLAELLGYPVDELVGAMIHSFMPDTPAGKTRSMEVYRKHLAGESVSGWELELRRKDGRPLWVNVWMEPGRGDDGTILASRSFFVDITDRVLAERERARLQEHNLYLQEEIKSVRNFEQIIGRSPALMEVLAHVGRVAPTDTSVLITGETGTGKELIASAIHSTSKRKDKPLIKVNCAALPAGLVESELFGHEKGAFTGAVAKRLGRFELADGGTIFLDEIGELPTEAQVKLLRVLQEREFDRVGGVAPVRVDVRVIAASNRDLLQAIHEKTFREDLYYRLNVFPIRLPPLRERRDDIPLLVQFLISKFALRIGKRLDGVSQRTMQRLQEYPWPGNIRELENVLERQVILTTGSMLDIAPDFLPTGRAASMIERAGSVMTPVSSTTNEPHTDGALGAGPALGAGLPTPPQPATARFPLPPSSRGFGESPLAYDGSPGAAGTVVGPTGSVIGRAGSVMTPVSSATKEPPHPGDTEPNEESGMRDDEFRIHLSALRTHPSGSRPVAQTLETVERDYILAVLQQTNWIINGPRGAAQILGLHPNTLRNRMKKLGITRSDA
jgi:PAS domain S-box-containing protein